MPARSFRRNQPIKTPDAQNRYLVFHKPYDVLSQFTDRQGDGSPQGARSALDGHRLTLKDYIPVAGVYPVGRLDRDSEGLMLLSNHGVLQHRLSDPTHGHPRTYWVQVERVPSDAALAALRKGILIQGRPTRPAQVQRLVTEPCLPPRTPPIRFRKTVPTSWLALTLREGRNRQVRRMTAAVGHPTLRLVRVQIGPLHLADLPPGQWRSLRAKERYALGQLVGLPL